MVSAFSEAERAFLGVRNLGRLATVDAAGQPHVVPVGWSFNEALGTIDIGGRDFAKSRKFRNVLANPKVAFVIDDVLPPWHPRCVEVIGTGEALTSVVPDGGGTPGAMIRITPTKIVSWGLDPPLA